MENHEISVLLKSLEARIIHMEMRFESGMDALAKSFYQTRDACQCLREELSSCAGTILEATEWT